MRGKQGMRLNLIRKYIDLNSGKEVSKELKEKELGVRKHLDSGSDAGSFLGFLFIATVFVLSTLGIIRLIVSVTERFTKFIRRFLKH